MRGAGGIQTCRVERYCGGILRPGCGRIYRIEHWPAPENAPDVIQTHGICESCLARELLTLVMSPTWCQQPTPSHASIRRIH